MTAEERRAWLSEIGRRGGAARAQQFTPESQRRARKCVSSAACARNGAKGAARTIQLHGYKALFEGCRRKRLANPSPCELVMIDLLSTLGLKHEREYCLGDTLYTLDFYIASYRLGIEVDGAIHDAGKPREAERKHQAERKRSLCVCLGIKLIRIHHSELAGDDLSAVIVKIQEIAGAWGAGDGRRERPQHG